MMIKEMPLLPEGYFVWLKGSEVIGISSKPSRDFWAKFGFRAAAPKECDGIGLSTSEFHRLSDEVDRSPQGGKR